MALPNQQIVDTILNKDRNKAVRRGSGKRKRTTKKETDKKVVKRSRASKPEEEIKYFVEKRNLEDLWKVAFPVGLEWDQFDALINKFNWDFKNLEEAFEEGGILYGKKTYVFVKAEPLHIHYKDGIDIVQVPTVVVIESPFPPSDKIAVGSVQGAMQQIIPMKQMKMDWLPYIPFQNRDRQVDRMDFEIFILSCTQRRSALRHLKEDRAMMFQYCVPYFYNPLVEDELEQSTVVNIVFPSEYPVVCDFDWDVDLLEDFVDELIEEERLSVEQKDEFKEFVKERVRAGMRANREARDARRKAREEMSEETKEAFQSIKFYKFYPRSSPVVPSFMKSSYISRYYPKPHQVVL